ncbi:ATP-binding cassette domain-containing protein [Rubrimonas cliftonensis]|nr:ATP-binding cassette domain-containing protein [Rubrimonas cliftonensis]
MACDHGALARGTLDALAEPARRPLRRAAALGVAAGLLWPAQAAALAWALAWALSGALSDAPTGSLWNGAAAPWIALCAFAALGLARAGLASAGQARAFRAAEGLVGSLRAGLVERAGRGSANGSAGPGALAALAGEKLDLLAPWLTRYGPARARAMVLPPAILALALSQSWAVALVLLVAGPLIPVFMALVGIAAREASRRQMVEVGALNDLLVDRLSALPDLRLLDAQDRAGADFARAAEALRARTMAVLAVAFLSSTVLELFAAIGVAMVAVWCGFSVLGVIGWGGWSGGVTPFAAIWLLLLAPEFFQPLRDLAAAWHDRAAAEAVAAELAALENGTSRPLLGAGAAAAPLDGPAAIRWRGLRRGSIRWPDGDIAPGERVALVGPSGSGKTTLLRLVAGLDRPDAGAIEVAGRALDDACADAWRARLAFAPQTPAFADESLRRILTDGRLGTNAEADAAALAPALAAAGAAGVVATLPRGLLARLGESGAGLSGGEARRILLARALHARPDVLLADEPTADLDAATAATVAEGLLALAATGATLIVATHDAALAARMDRVIAAAGR